VLRIEENKNKNKYNKNNSNNNNNNLVYRTESIRKTFITRTESSNDQIGNINKRINRSVNRIYIENPKDKSAAKSKAIDNILESLGLLIEDEDQNYDVHDDYIEVIVDEEISIDDNEITNEDEIIYNDETNEVVANRAVEGNVDGDPSDSMMIKTESDIDIKTDINTDIEETPNKTEETSSDTPTSTIEANQNTVTDAITKTDNKTTAIDDLTTKASDPVDDSTSTESDSDSYSDSDSDEDSEKPSPPTELPPDVFKKLLFSMEVLSPESQVQVVQKSKERAPLIIQSSQLKRQKEALKTTRDLSPHSAHHAGPSQSGGNSPEVRPGIPISSLITKSSLTDRSPTPQRSGRQNAPDANSNARSGPLARAEHFNVRAGVPSRLSTALPNPNQNQSSDTEVTQPKITREEALKKASHFNDLSQSNEKPLPQPNKRLLPRALTSSEGRERTAEKDARASVVMNNYVLQLHRLAAKTQEMKKMQREKTEAQLTLIKTTNENQKLNNLGDSNMDIDNTLELKSGDMRARALLKPRAKSISSTSEIEGNQVEYDEMSELYYTQQSEFEGSNLDDSSLVNDPLQMQGDNNVNKRVLAKRPLSSSQTSSLSTTSPTTTRPGVPTNTGRPGVPTNIGRPLSSSRPGVPNNLANVNINESHHTIDQNKHQEQHARAGVPTNTRPGVPTNTRPGVPTNTRQPGVHSRHPLSKVDAPTISTPTSPSTRPGVPSNTGRPGVPTNIGRPLSSSRPGVPNNLANVNINESHHNNSSETISSLGNSRAGVPRPVPRPIQSAGRAGLASSIDSLSNNNMSNLPSWLTKKEQDKNRVPSWISKSTPNDKSKVDDDGVPKWLSESLKNEGDLEWNEYISENPFTELDNLEDMINNIDNYLKNGDTYDDEDCNMEDIIHTIDKYITNTLEREGEDEWQQLFSDNPIDDDEGEVGISLKERIAQLYAVGDRNSSTFSDKSDVILEESKSQLISYLIFLVTLFKILIL
jgi:hypothetical protein